MANVEKVLHEYFANATDNDEGPAQASTPAILREQDTVTTVLDPPFAKVNTVAPNSPAERAGLKPGDEIRNFGYVNRDNNDGLKKVAECVQGNEGVSVLFLPFCCELQKLMVNQEPVFIKVSRASGVAQREELRLTLTPTKDWGGRGMLGCHILPI